MNTPNPLIPQGSLERQSKGKSTVRIAIFTVISIHAVFFAGLLMQGCRRDEAKTPLKAAENVTESNSLPPIDTNSYPAGAEVAQVPTPVPFPTSSTAPPATGYSSLAPTGSVPSVVTEPLPFPASSSTVQPAAEEKSRTYTIGRGDTLVKIARAQGTTVGAITRANPNLDPSKLKPGQKIQVPASSQSTTGGVGYKEPGTAVSANTHTVKPGETLTRIARQHGTTVRAIRTANGLKSDRVVVGQKLKLPSAQSSAGTTAPSKTAAMSKASPSETGYLGTGSEPTNLR
jgi:LysM repeat protein